MIKSTADGVLQIAESKPRQPSTPANLDEPETTGPINIVITESPTFRKADMKDLVPVMREQRTSIDIGLLSIDRKSLEEFEALEGFGIKSDQATPRGRQVLQPTVV